MDRNIEYHRLHSARNNINYNINYLQKKIEDCYLEKGLIEGDCHIRQDVCLLLTDELFDTIHKLLYKVEYLKDKLTDIEKLIYK